MNLKDKIRVIENFPKDGISFVLILILMDITLQQVFLFNPAWIGATACLMDEFRIL